MISFRLIVYFAVLALVASACVQETKLAPAPTLSSNELTVAAAADLQFAFTDIAELYEQKTGNKVNLVFGSTGQLAQQIENGAPYDMFAAANIAYVTQLADKQLVLSDTVELYARGRIVLAVNKNSEVRAVNLKDLAASEIKHIAIANPDHAPYGVAAREALQATGVWEQIQNKLVFGENVRQTLQYVQTGDVEAAIISLSVADVPEITWTLIDDSLYLPIDQALAVVAKTSHADTARDFAQFVNGEFGRPIMRQYGFILPDEVTVPATPQP